MSKCKKCGYELDENDKFCPYCGAKVEELLKDTEKCKKALNEVQEDKISSNFNMEFNEKNNKKDIEEMSTAEAMQAKFKTDKYDSIDDESDFSEYNTGDKKFKILMIIPLIIIFIAGSAIIYMIFHDNNKGKSSNSDNSAASSSSSNSTNTKSENEKSDEEKNENLSKYILPYSDKKPVTKEELKNLSQKQLSLARNEIFARHGYVFGGYFKSYFSSKSWYKPNPNFKGEAKDLSALERHNIKVIMIQEGLGKNVAPSYDSDYNSKDYEN